ncbi:MAG: hypothetical protein RSC91_11015 [Clostridia bacterium]
MASRGLRGRGSRLPFTRFNPAIFSVQLRWSVTVEAAVKSAAEIQNESKTYLQALAIVSKISYNRIDIGSMEQKCSKMQRQ